CRGAAARDRDRTRRGLRRRLAVQGRARQIPWEAGVSRGGHLVSSARLAGGSADLAGPAPGAAGVGGDGSAVLATAGSGRGFAVWSGVRLRPVHALPDGTVTPDGASA